MNENFLIKIDWNELFTTKCYACGYPIEAGDRWVEAMNNNYHSQCFNCSVILFLIKKFWFFCLFSIKFKKFDSGLQEEFGGTELFGQKWSTHVQKPRPLNKILKQYDGIVSWLFRMGGYSSFYLVGKWEGGKTNTKIRVFIIF